MRISLYFRIPRAPFEDTGELGLQHRSPFDTYAGYGHAQSILVGGRVHY